MSKNNITSYSYREAINRTLMAAVNKIEFNGAVKEAMRYSLEAGGKRIRPMLLLEFYRVYSGEQGELNTVMPAAIAIEMIHTFSLIHDDLPCMDNDDLRRGKPSCHKVFPEWSALLAGDALPLYALELVSESTENNLNFKNRLRTVNEICRAAGVSGMIGGQQLDMEFEKRLPEKHELISMYNLKTSALLKTACCTGCILAGAGEEDINNAGIFAEKLGLAFQIKDDILDVTGDEKKLGKPVGSDRKQGKTTYVTLFGLENAEREAERLTDEALECLKSVPDNEFLFKLTKELLKRKY